MRIVIYLLIGLLFITPVIGGKVNYNMVLKGDSMYPTITDGEMVTINTITKHDIINIGGIYCYRPDYSLWNVPLFGHICHRLGYITNGLYYFSGDNNFFYDEGIERKYIAWEIKL